NLIVIFSNEGDRSTSEVMRWLEQMGERHVLRINSHTAIDSIYMDDETFNISMDSGNISLDAIKSVWYRRGNSWFAGLFSKIVLDSASSLAHSLNAVCKAEDMRIREYFHYLLMQNARALGHPAKGDLNKPITLHQARKAGFLTPSFSILNTKPALEEKLSSGKAFVTKAVSDGLYVWDFKD